MQPPRRTSPGKPDKLGASYDGKGVNFAIFSKNATKVELCLFDADGNVEQERIELTARTDDIWHVYVEDLMPGQVYGYRVHGPWSPEEGHLFNPDKLLLDPYARGTIGCFSWKQAMTDASVDTAPYTMKAWVAEPLPPRAQNAGQKPAHAKTDGILYEMHIKGYTKTDPKVDEDLRGTAAGLGSRPVIDHLKSMNVTSVELLPVAAKLHDERLEKLNLRNYWGYNTLGFFAIENEYLKTGKREEFRDMVDRFHEAGIAVILDVVFNHTAEGGADGPVISFRGIDNSSYYKLDPHDKKKYVDDTGCGNTLDFSQPVVRRLVLDSLRYWVEEFGVDGFRFDLATVLGRGPDFDKNAPFFTEIAADPVLSKVRLIAEPWDIGPGGYQVGNFPQGWGEWNDKFRDTVRRFWRGEEGIADDFATRLLGSSPEFCKNGRASSDSVNFVTAHDGFTLHDLVSHSWKKNTANGEGNRDGHHPNYSDNHGAEGETENRGIIDRRERQKRNFLTTLFLSQGTPMLLAGDEHGNSQEGNNNAYCQDNVTGWLNWDKVTEEGRKLTEFVKKLALFRQENPVLRNPEFLHDREDIEWIATNGGDMRTEDWINPVTRCLGMLLKDEKGSLLAVFNAHAAPVEFTLPKTNESWKRVLDTTDPELQDDAREYVSVYKVPEKSVVVFRRKSH